MWGMMGVSLGVPILIAPTMISESLDPMEPPSKVLGQSAGKKVEEGSGAK